MIAAIDKSVKLYLALPARTPHAILSTASLKFLACLPALTTGYLVRVHLESVFFDAAEDVEPPVVPHGWPCLDNVIWLGEQLWQVLNGRVELLLMAVVLDVLSLLPQRCRRDLCLVLLSTFLRNLLRCLRLAILIAVH